MEIKVNKAYVFDAVDETAAYIGAKSVGDEGAYERIFTTDADRTLLENYWSEACELATERLKSFITSLSDNTVNHSVNLSKNYDVTLKTPSNYDTSMDNSINSSLFHYFVYFIVSKWCRLTSKPDAESYAIDATSMLNDAVRKLYHRKRPQKPTDNE